MGILTNILIWTLTWFLSGVVVALTAFQLTIYSEADSDDGSPAGIASEATAMAKYEIFAQILLTCACLFPLYQYTVFFLCSFLMVYNILRYQKEEFVIDPTEVYRPGNIRK